MLLPQGTTVAGWQVYITEVDAGYRVVARRGKQEAWATFERQPDEPAIARWLDLFGMARAS